MAGSVVLIVLGLVGASYQRGQRSMYNIDFTGGTLVTIRLNEDDPQVKQARPSRSGPASSARRPRVLPDVTVESLKVGGDKTLTRFNIRTTEEKPERVKERILKAFGPALERVEMTFGEPEADPGRGAGRAERRGRRRRPVDRFAGGRQYDLKFNTTAFNSTQAPAQVVAAEFVKVLGGGEDRRPGLAVRDRRPAAAGRGAPRLAAARPP